MTGIPRAVYLAGDYARKYELLKYETQLERAGWESTTRWLRQPDLAGEGAGNPGIGTGGVDGEQHAEWAREFAAQDLEDIAAADLLVGFTTGEKTRGGRHTETGAALALGKPVLLVGPRETVFHWHPLVIAALDNWPAALAVLHSVKREPKLWIKQHAGID